MSAILYRKQILLTQPQLKKYYFPICAKRVEPAWGLRAGAPVLGWGGQTASGGLRGSRAPPAQVELEREVNRNLCLYLFGYNHQLHRDIRSQGQ